MRTASRAVRQGCVKVTRFAEVNNTSVKAFTLSEIVIVVVILGVLASFALPNYFRGLEKQKERNAEQNLLKARLAAQSWQAATSVGAIASGGFVNSPAGLNQALRIDIVLEPDQSIAWEVRQDFISISISWSDGSGTPKIMYTDDGLTPEFCVDGAFEDNDYVQCAVLPN